MTLNMNQFAMEPVEGDISLPRTGMVISGVIDSSEAVALTAGQLVKLVNTTSANSVPVVTALTSLSDAPFGAIIRNLKNANYVANAPVELALRDTYIWLTASEAINAGAYVEYNYVTKKIRNATGLRPVIGMIQNKVTADGQLARVLLDIPLSESATA